MTPDKTLAIDATISFSLLLAFGALGVSFCTDTSEGALAKTSIYEVNPIDSCAEEIGLLHPRHQAILVHGSPRREYVSPSLARWYCRKVTPKGAEQAMRELRPLTSEEVATW